MQIYFYKKKAEKGGGCDIIMSLQEGKQSIVNPIFELERNDKLSLKVEGRNTLFFLYLELNVVKQIIQQCFHPFE